MSTPDLAAWRSLPEDASFEETQAALDAVVAHLEQGQLSLADSLECYELGVLLADRCERLLDSAVLRVAEIDAASMAESDGPGSAVMPIAGAVSPDDVPF